MSNPFARTLRSLAADRSRASFAATVASVGVLVAWAAWFAVARVPVYAVSREARLETEARALPLASRVDGRLSSVRAVLGRDVADGEILFELDAEVERGRVEEERARQEGLWRRLDALRLERSAALLALEDVRRDARSAVAEAQAELRTAEEVAGLAREEAARARRLRAEGLLPESDHRRSESLAAQRSAEADAARRALERAEAQAARDDADRRMQLARLDGVNAEIEAALTASGRAAERLAAEEAWRVIRSPVTGVVGELAPVGPGSFVAEGDVLATVIPHSSLRIVAAFQPAEVLGRIHAGQPARIRFAGFPWLEYGTLPARVESVSGEVRDGLVWVHLVADLDGPARIPAQHGLPGEVTVELERVAPATLVLRAVGRLLTGAGEDG